MTLTTKDDRIAALEARIQALEAERQAKSPAAPIAVPQKPAPRPAWISQSDDNVGMNYSGKPTPSYGGESWVRERKPDGSWKDPNSGQWRDSSGRPVPVTPEAPPRLQERSPQHEQAVRILDDHLGRK
jgi:hypothetical protein